MTSQLSAAAKLKPSKLSDQLETLNTDVDLASLNLAVQGRASFQLLERITSARVQRTIEGSSTLTIVANDYDRALLNSGYIPEQGSGYIGVGLDCELDGLWFRLWAWSKSGDNLTLTFIDREVAVLKQWPPTSEGVKMYRTMPANAFGPLTRFHFAKRLIDDVAGILPIRFRCPALDDPTSSTTSDPANDPGSQIAKGHGFPANVTITVKHHPASAAQFNTVNALLALADRFLDANGVKDVAVRRRIMIAAVMTITQESDAGVDDGPNGDHVGPFQQAPPFWPATGNLIVDGGEFIDRAIAYNNEHPSVPLWQLCEGVQLSGQGSLYDQWRTEATTTVDAYLGTITTASSAAQEAVAAANQVAPDPTKGQFIRGRLETPTAAARKHKQIVYATSQGKKVIVREDNWSCLTRLAAEIGYRCFCVSGTVYFISDYELFHQRVAMTLKEGDPGVDVLDPDFTQGKPNAQITVACRADRWKAPPGTVVAVEDLGPASGRWLVTSTERSLFDPATTITLKKPVASIPESAAPEHGAGQTSGTTTFDGSGKPITPDPNASAQRKKIVNTALKAIALQKQSGGSRYHYLQSRPMPGGLFASSPEHIDCSAFATLVYKAAGCPDPNGFGYNGAGDTGSLAAHGTPTDTPQPGDLIFYHDDWAKPGHVAVYLGDGQIANMGSEGEPVEEAILAPGVPLGNRTYPLTAKET